MYSAQASNRPAAVFFYVLLKMLDHVLVTQADQLEGVYQTAFIKMFDLLEDSGWALKREDAEGEDEDEDLQNEPPPGSSMYG